MNEVDEFISAIPAASSLVLYVGGIRDGCVEPLGAHIREVKVPIIASAAFFVAEPVCCADIRVHQYTARTSVSRIHIDRIHEVTKTEVHTHRYWFTDCFRVMMLDGYQGRAPTDARVAYGRVFVGSEYIKRKR